MTPGQTTVGHFARDETIVFEAGTHTDTMSMKYADLKRLTSPTGAEFAHHL